MASLLALRPPISIKVNMEESPSELIAFAITAFTGFFAIMNPIANLPVYMSLVEGASEKSKRRVKKHAVLTAFLIIVAFVALGKIIFSLFGITIPAFKITGGVIIFLVGLDMLRAQNADIKDMKEPEKFDESIAVSPLATPLLAGPGSIVTAMTFVSGGTVLDMVIVVAAFGAVCLLHYWAFGMSQMIVDRIGANVMVVLGKIMGLIVAVIGTGMLIQGIRLAFDIME